MKREKQIGIHGPVGKLAAADAVVDAQQRPGQLLSQLAIVQPACGGVEVACGVGGLGSAACWALSQSRSTISRSNAILCQVWTAARARRRSTCSAGGSWRQARIAVFQSILGFMGWIVRGFYDT
jgi:hypothetical protein